MTLASRELLPPVIAPTGVSPPFESVDPGRDADFARVALPLLPTIARVAASLTRDRSDADDLVQETFLKAFRHWHSFVPGSDCKRWLAAICRNTFLAQRARRRWVTAVGDDMELETFAAVHLHKLARDHGVEDVFARLDVGPAIREAIDALDAPFRDVVMLVDVEEFRYEEAADVWRAFNNRYWPAAYHADATGRSRFHHFGEGRYEEQDKVVAKLLAERDAARTPGDR